MPESSSITWQWSTFDALTPHALYEILRARMQVFVVEQECAYQDCDGIDRVSHHLWMNGPDGGVGAYLRVVPPGMRYLEPSIGRVLTTNAVRGTGVGKALVAEAVARTEELYPDQGIRIAAQRYLLRFYNDFGFESTGHEFLEDGIPHTEMLKIAKL